MAIPIMVRTQARSGSTLFMQLLGLHENISIAWKYPFEVRMAQYMAHAFKVLTSEADHSESSRPNFFHFNNSEKWVGHNPFNTNEDLSYVDWLKTDFKSEMKGFYKKNVSRFYEEASKGKKEISYFAEKCFYIANGNNFQNNNVIFELYRQEELATIFLVRDHRSVACSHLSFFNENKRPDLDRKLVFSNLSKHGNSLANEFLSTKNPIIVKYEDLILDAENTLKKTFESLKLNNSDDVVSGIVEEVSRISKKSFVSHRTTSSLDSISRWKKELSDDEICFIDKSFRVYKEVFGY